MGELAIALLLGSTAARPRCRRRLPAGRGNAESARGQDGGVEESGAVHKPEFKADKPRRSNADDQNLSKWADVAVYAKAAEWMVRHNRVVHERHREADAAGSARSGPEAGLCVRRRQDSTGRRSAANRSYASHVASDGSPQPYRVYAAGNARPEG